MKALNTMVLFLISLSFNSLADIDSLTLSVNGNVTKITVGDLEKLPQHDILTSTLYTAKEKFTGVKFSDFANKYKIKGSIVRVLAWDDYSYTLSIDEMVNYGVIIAYKRNSKRMTIEDFGPFATIYPKDDYPELNKLDVDAKTVIQVKALEVK